MARLICITNGLRGGLNATYELTRRLANAGHEIHMVGHRDLAEDVEAQGLPYHRLTADDEAMESLQQAINASGRLRSLPAALKLRSGLIKSDEIARVVSSLAADALIIDIEAHYAVLATRPLGLPTVLKSDWFSMTRRWGIPPLHSNLSLPHTFQEKRIADLAWGKALGERLIDSTVAQLHPTRLMRRAAPFRYDTISRHDLSLVAKERGLRLRAMTSQTNWLRPHTYDSIPMLTSTASELDFGKETNANVHSIGPLIRRDRIDSVVTAETHADWARFRDRNTSTSRPLLYCSFGTVLRHTESMVNKIIAAVTSRPDWDLVIGLGGLGTTDAAATSENVLVLDYAPQAEVLATADLAIIHGGINTINECLVEGVPMLVHASGSTDQPGCAARVDHHGVGVRARFDGLSEQAITDLIEQLLIDRELQTRVSAMQRSVLRYEQEGDAEQLIERLLQGAL